VDDDRLIETSDLPLEREMLRAAAEETVPASVRRHALASLGLFVVASPAVLSSLGGSAAAATSTLGKTVGWQVWLPKLTLFLSLGGVAAVGGAIAWDQVQSASRESASSQVASPRAPHSRGAKSVVAVPAETQVTHIASHEAAHLPEVPAAETTAALRGSGTAKVKTTTRRSVPHLTSETTSANDLTETKRAASIRGEIEKLDQARAELRRGAPDAALAVIRDYFTRYPTGEFGAEAELIRREALRTRK
jgi:hypothetical protein